MEEKITSIKSTLEDLGRGSFGSLDSGRNPSLLRRLDSVSSFNSEQSIDQFLSQQRERDSRRVEDPLPDVTEKTMDYSYQEEDRPLATQKWESTLTKSFRRSQQSESMENLRTHSPTQVSDRAKDEMLANMTQLQRDLYMRLEDCQRQLEFARHSSIEQETQAQIRIEELTAALEAARSNQSRHEGYGESLAVRNRELENQLEESRRRAQSWEERVRQADDRSRLLEDSIRDVEKRIRSTEEELIRTTDKFKTAQRDNESLVADLRTLKENSSRLESALHSAREEVLKGDSGLLALKEQLKASDVLVRDLRDENQGLVTALERRSDECERLEEEKGQAEERLSEVKAVLKQQEEVASRNFEVRFREAEDRLREGWRRQHLEMEQQIAELLNNRENLELELASRPSSKRVRELECQIERLEERLTQEVTRKQRNVSMSVTPTRFRRTPLGEMDRNQTRPSRKGEAKEGTLRLVMQELKEANPTEVVGKVRELVQSRKEGLAAQQLLSKLRKLVQECSPHTEEPSAKRIWHWVRTVTEDLMKLRTGQEGNWAQVMAALGVVSPRAVYPKVSSVLGDMDRLKAVLAKAKAAVKLSDQASIDDLEAALSKAE